ncbi:MAG: hypothetical protein LBQ00_02230 [Syntrophobacterales bacterium]|jgi:ADP-heptose:LPS heptosyltransferase|nr:hypothetical protein [Syntrophobacterales bacterium]
MEFKEILLIHLGGLGDFCLSESTFLSITRHFRESVVGLGTRRFFNLFKNYFDRIHNIESARWLYLFSNRPTDILWEKIIFIGKDRAGTLRERWQRFSRTDLLFIDMYPEGAFGDLEDCLWMSNSSFPQKDDKAVVIQQFAAEHQWIEDYQLAQLTYSGITALRREILPKPSSRVVLYPEKRLKKGKWHYHNFTKLHQSLKSRGLETYIIQPFDLDLGIVESTTIEELTDMKAFLEQGGVFISNDSGMAHLAGMCGLFTITIFTDFDPLVWHPRGVHQILKWGKDRIDVETIEKIILDHLAMS